MGVVLSKNAIMLYNIEVIFYPSGYTNGVYPVSDAWGLADNGANLAASANYSYTGLVWGMRINITQWVTGTLTASLAQY